MLKLAMDLKGKLPNKVRINLHYNYITIPLQLRKIRTKHTKN